MIRFSQTTEQSLCRPLYPWSRSGKASRQVIKCGCISKVTPCWLVTRTAIKLHWVGDRSHKWIAANKRRSNLHILSAMRSGRVASIHWSRQRKNGPRCCNTDFREKNVAKWRNPSRKRQIDKNYHVEHSKATQVIWYKASIKCYSYARARHAALKFLLGIF